MGEWEGELGDWKEDMEMATYPNDPSTIPCASINRLTAITITPEGPLEETLEGRGVLATLQAAPLGLAGLQLTCLIRSPAL